MSNRPKSTFCACIGVGRQCKASTRQKISEYTLITVRKLYEGTEARSCVDGIRKADSSLQQPTSRCYQWFWHCLLCVERARHRFVAGPWKTGERRNDKSVKVQRQSISTIILAMIVHLGNSPNFARKIHAPPPLPKTLSKLCNYRMSSRFAPSDTRKRSSNLRREGRGRAENRTAANARQLHRKSALPMQVACSPC